MFAVFLWWTALRVSSRAVAAMRRMVTGRLLSRKKGVVSTL